MHLGHLVGNGAQRGHGAEGHALEVHVEPGHDDAHATVGQLVAHVHEPVVEKLGLVYAHHVNVCREEQYGSRRVNGRGHDGVAVVAHHALLTVTRVYGRLEYLHLLVCEHGTLHTAYQLLCLAREHGAADHLYASGTAHLSY